MIIKPIDRRANHDGPPLHMAAEWFVRIRDGELDPQAIAAWERWLATDADHRAAYDGMQELWQGLGRIPERMLPSIEPPAPARHWAWAAAAALVLGLALCALHWKGDLLLGRSSTHVYETEAGEHRDLTLADGSRLTLAGGSLAWIDFTPRGRQVTLDRGEIFVTVAREIQRPFVVRAGSATITALGTAFNVRKAGGRVQVTVAEGAIKVAPAASTAATHKAANQAQRADANAELLGGEYPDARIGAGQQITVDPAIDPAADTSSTAMRISPADPQAVAAWRSGQLQYLGEPLKYVVDDLNRYSKRHIFIEDPAVGELKLTGTVFEHDIDAWLRSVEVLLPVKVQRPSADTIVLARRQP